jgi:hypothetical protein
MLARTTLSAAVLAALFAAPALAQTPPIPPPAPTLDAIKPCYVVANESQRESVVVSGHYFTKFAPVDLYVDDIAADHAGDPPQADLNGNLNGSVLAPIIDEGQRAFTLRATEHDNSASSAIVTSKITRLSVEQSPASANTSDRVRFRGRGFTDLTKPLYMHYVFGGRSKKTIEIGLPLGDCGTFNLRRKQFPFRKSPQRGVWTIQFDQTPKYDPKASPRVPLTVKVSRKIRPTRARGR